MSTPSLSKLRFIISWSLVALLVAVLTIAACGDDETPTTTTGPGVTPTITAQATPTATTSAMVPVSPRLRVANPPDPDQHQVPYAGNQVTWSKMPEYEHLIGHDIKSNEEIPELAESWDIGPDGKTWTFELKEGVPFYKDGKPFNNYTFSAKDVSLSLDLLNGEMGAVSTTISQNAARWASLFGGPENWEVVNDYEFIIRTPQVNLDLGFNLSDVWESGMLSKDHWDAVGGEEGYQNDPIGTGPWTFVSRTINQVYLHRRVDDHWRKTPEFQELEMLQVREPATRLAMLFAKEVEIIPLVQDQRQQVLAEGFTVVKGTLPSVNQAISFIYYRQEWYCPNGQPPAGQTQCGQRAGYDPNDPLRNPNVRVALNYAVNRNQLNQVFYNGEGFPLVDEFPTWRSDWQDRWAPYPGPDGKTGREGGWPYPYDPEEAKAMLAAEGYPNGFETTLNCLQTHTVIPDWPGMCEAVINDFAAIGVETTLEMEEAFGTFRAKAVAADRPNWMYSASPGYSPICNRVTFGFPWELGNGYREFEEVDAIREVCRTATTIQARDAGAIEFADAWISKAFSVPLVWVFSHVVYNPEIVAEYEANFSNFGTARYHEWTKAQYR